jgi:hypothetical protein
MAYYQVRATPLRVSSVPYMGETQPLAEDTDAAATMRRGARKHLQPARLRDTSPPPASEARGTNKRATTAGKRKNNENKPPRQRGIVVRVAHAPLPTWVRPSMCT